MLTPDETEQEDTSKTKQIYAYSIEQPFVCLLSKVAKLTKVET